MLLIKLSQTTMVVRYANFYPFLLTDKYTRTVSPCAYQNDALLTATMAGDLPADLELVLEGATNPCGLRVFPRDFDGSPKSNYKEADVQDISVIDNSTEFPIYYSTSGNISNFGPGSSHPGLFSPCAGYGNSCIEMQNRGNSFLLDGQGFTFSKYSFITQMFGFSTFNDALIQQFIDDEIEPIDSITKTTLKNIVVPGNLELSSLGPPSSLEAIPGADAILSASLELVTESIKIEGNFSFYTFQCNHTIDLSGITIADYCCCTIDGRYDLESNCHNKDIGNLFNDSCPVFFKGPANTDCVCPEDNPTDPSAASRKLPSLLFSTLFTVMTLSRMFRS